jgi:hypothetical protein
MMSFEIWQPSQMGVDPVGRRLLEDRIAATLPKVYGQWGRADARGQCRYSAAALVRESLAALPRMPSSLRIRHQVEPAAAQ